MEGKRNSKPELNGFEAMLRVDFYLNTEFSPERLLHLNTIKRTHYAQVTDIYLYTLGACLCST